MGLHFEWDKRKAISNLSKHGMTFDEGSTVLCDPLAFIFDDEDHSAEEGREIIIGHSISGRLLLISFTKRAEGVIRIISVRLATKKEQEDYEEKRNF